MWPGIVQQYRTFLPFPPQMKAISLQEGNTPLILAEKLSERLHIKLYVKFEGTNPTGSFKDRGMAACVSMARYLGKKQLICASTGNTSASAAAYGARAGIPVAVIIPAGQVALGKLSQALIYGALVLAIQGNFDEALRLVREMAAEGDLELVNSINPHRIEGQKTVAFEICDQLQEAPDFLCLPVGNAGNITACWKGFQEYQHQGCIDKTPRLLGIQAAGAAPLVDGHPIAAPETLATAIRIGNPARWQEAVRAISESQGLLEKVTDEEITSAYQDLANQEGIYCEPASASSLAGIKKLVERGDIKRGSLIVALLTGHGLKDPDVTTRMMPPPKTMKPVKELLQKELQL